MATRDDIQRLLLRGLSAGEIARRLGLAGPTVAYHAERIRRGVPATPSEREGLTLDGGGRRLVATREQVSILLADGLSRGEIARRLGLSKSTVSYHARRLGAPVDARGARRYDWDQVQRFYDAGHSVRQCQERFGFSRQSWHAAVKRGAVEARPHGLPLEELLANGVHRGRNNIKLRLVRAGVKEKRCETCGLDEWMDLPIPLSLHHINGDRQDNRLENLKLLCPNCHSQTDTFAGRNVRRLATTPEPA